MVYVEVLVRIGRGENWAVWSSSYSPLGQDGFPTLKSDPVSLLGIKKVAKSCWQSFQIDW